MRLVEQHIINKSNTLFKEIDDLCFLSKNLYNKANYIIRQEFIKTSKEKKEGKLDHANWINYYQLQKQLQNDKDVDYIALPRKVSQQILKTLDKNWKSFFKFIHNGRPNLPNYKHKTKGRNLLVYTIQAISKKELKNNIVRLSQTNIRIQTKQKDIQEVRIIPKLKHYIIEIIYKKEVQDLKLNKNNIAGIDLGVNNLCTITSNVNNIKPVIINGRPLKSINQYYNKKKAKLQSFVGDKSSNKIHNLTNKRNRKINNYLHNVSRIIINFLIQNNVGILVIGKNKLWKTEINMNKKNNQSFVNIPHARLINMIEYKAELVGIDVVITEESYTSKCSFIDDEKLCHHENYLGRRIHRGLFKSSNNVLINADCNGSGNIIRKAFSKAFADGIEGVVVHPIRINPYKLVS